MQLPAGKIVLLRFHIHFFVQKQSPGVLKVLLKISQYSQENPNSTACANIQTYFNTSTKSGMSSNNYLVLGAI